MQRELDEQAAAHLASAQQLCVLLTEGRLAQADRTVQVLTESLGLVGDRLREALLVHGSRRRGRVLDALFVEDEGFASSV